MDNPPTAQLLSLVARTAARDKTAQLEASDWRRLFRDPRSKATLALIEQPDAFRKLLVLVSRGWSTRRWATEAGACPIATALYVRHACAADPEKAELLAAARQVWAERQEDRERAAALVALNEEDLSPEQYWNRAIKARDRGRSGGSGVTINNTHVSVDARKQVVLSVEDWRRSGLEARRVVLDNAAKDEDDASLY